MKPIPYIYKMYIKNTFIIQLANWNKNKKQAQKYFTRPKTLSNEKGLFPFRNACKIQEKEV